MSAVSVEEHAAAIESLLADLGTRAAQRVPLTDALGRVAFHDVTSPSIYLCSGIRRWTVMRSILARCSLRP